MKKFGVVVFPGSNCDQDAYNAINSMEGASAEFLWHRSGSIASDIECVVLPGGFSYGDYLRSGAIARFSPIMKAVIDHAKAGKYVIGICNGFQVLTEAALLPGALLRNTSLTFICKDVHLRVDNTKTSFTSAYSEGSVVRFPIAHGEGNYTAAPEIIEQLEERGQVVFRYASATGDVAEQYNPNGSARNIAGIINAQGNVLGLMPHPERVCDPLLGGADGVAMWQSLLQS